MGNQRGKRGIFAPMTVYGFPLPPLHPLPVGGVVVFAASNGIGSVGIVVPSPIRTAISWTGLKQRWRTYELSEAFLYNIQPVPIAECP